MQKITADSPGAASVDLVADNIAKLKTIFPELLTEGKDGISVNLDVLKQLVGDKTVTDAEEKYGLNWHGKRAARQLALTPSTGTLRPCPEDSEDWDNTKNIFIEGDNLEVLKLLQKSYSGKVKLIYIDPPYNTGKDFVYPDNFQDSIKNYLEITGQVEGGQKISSNTEASGRFHGAWLNMLYPRLKVSRDFLSANGAIVVSCDDNESARLRVMLDEVFGEENFVADVAIVTGANQSGDGVLVQKNYEKCYIYAKDIEKLTIKRVDQVNESLRNLNDAPTPLETREDMGYTIYYNPTSGDAKAVFDYDKSKIELNTISDVYEDCLELIESGYTPIRPGFRNKKLHRWRWGKETFEERLSDIVFREANGSWGAYFIQSGFNPPKNVWNFAGGAAELLALFDGNKVFDYPKGLSFLRYLLATLAPDDSVVVDFFAGSGTTAHALFTQNLADKGNRRCIAVQLPEPLNPDNKDQKTAADFCDKLGKPRTIAELTKERLRRAAAKIKEENPLFAGDLGFRVFKLDSTNIHEWDPNRDNLVETLEAHQEHLKANRSEQDILFELLLKLGLDLCVPIETKQIGGHSVHSVGAGTLLVCLSTSIPQTDVEQLAGGIIDWHKAQSPSGETTLVFRDSAFANDIAKTNLTAILHQNGLETVRSL